VTLTVGELPTLVRAGFYALLLCAIAAANLAFDDFYAPLAVLLVFLFVVLPAAGRVFGRGREEIDDRPTAYVFVGFVVLLALLTAIEIALVPDFDLGPISGRSPFLFQPLSPMAMRPDGEPSGSERVRFPE
jgi:hypothetical protein